MATTEFTVLYPRVRTLLGDLDAAAPAYSNDNLDAAIRLALDHPDEPFSEAAPSGSKEITPELTAKVDIMRLSARAALNLLQPSAGAFSYRTPMLSVSRGGAGAFGNIGRLLDLLRQVADGDIALDSDSDWEQLFEGVNRVEEKLGRIGVALEEP